MNKSKHSQMGIDNAPLVDTLNLIQSNGKQAIKVFKEEIHIDNALHKAADKYTKRFSPWLYSSMVECYTDAAKWQKQQMIDKACDWLANVSIEDMTYKYNNFDTSEGWYKFIKDFKKYMKGE